MKKLSWIILVIGGLILGIIGLNACVSKRQGADDFASWYKQNITKMTIQKQVGDFQFQLSYLAPELLLMQEYGAAVAERADYDSLLADRAAFDYYAFRVQNASSQDPILKHTAWQLPDYQERVSYMAFDMQHDIKLLQGGDTTACALYHFERSYDVTPFSTLMLAFPAQSEKATFLYDDQVWKLGPVMLAAPKPEALFTSPAKQS